MSRSLRFYQLWKETADLLAWRCTSTLYVADMIDEQAGGQTCTAFDMRKRARVLARRAVAAQDRMHVAQERVQLERREARHRSQEVGDDGNP